MPSFRLLAVLVLLGVSGLVACSGPSPRDGEPDTTPADPVHYVQLRMTEDKNAAEDALAAAVRWWDRAQGELPEPKASKGQPSPLDIHWRSPLYRVRLGPFASRSQAQTVLEAARGTFPDAFVARGRASDDG